MMKRSFLFLLFLGLIIRILLIGNTGFIADISFWKSWSMAASDHGITWTTHNTNINYPPGFIYVLWLMGKFYTLFGDPHNYNIFWRENNFTFLFVSKSFAIVSDCLIACLIYWFASQKDKLKQLGANLQLTTNNIQPLILSMAFYFNPVVIMDSAQWGQVESLGILFTLIAIIFLFWKKPLLGVAIFTIGVYMKLQNIIYIPIIFLFIWRYFDAKTFFKSLGIFIFATAVVILPFIINKDTNQVLYLMTLNSDYFPYLSLNAHNLWWIVAQGAGMKVNDKITVFLITNAKTMGLLLFSSAYFISALLVFLKPSARNLLIALTTGIFAFFLFTTQSHERYSYPVLVFLLLFYPFVMSLRGADTKATKQSPYKQNQSSVLDRGIASTKKIEHNFFSVAMTFHNQNLYFWFLYLLLTITIFFNIHMGMVLNYPQNGIPVLTELSTKSAGIFNSYILIILYFLLLPFVFSEISVLYLSIPVLLLIFGLTSTNLTYLISGKVSLTRFKPISTKQDFGSLETNMTVNSFGGWKTWNRLSNNYFYYRKGFGSHANSSHIFDIAGKFKKFTTDVGIDTEAGTQASTVFKILGDGKKLYESPKMGRFDFPRHADIDITGVRHLELVITDNGDGINSDHAGWYNPVLFR